MMYTCAACAMVEQEAVNRASDMEDQAILKQLLGSVLLSLFMVLCNTAIAASASSTNNSISHDVLSGGGGHGEFQQLCCARCARATIRDWRIEKQLPGRWWFSCAPHCRACDHRRLAR